MITKFFINKTIKIQKSVNDKANEIYPEFNKKFKEINSQFEEEWDKWEKIHKRKSSMP